MGIYLDYNATSPIDERVLELMVDVYRNNYGNADSRTHDYGDSARRIVEEARQKVADMLDIKKDEVFFTSGATESNNIAIRGLKDFGIKNGKKHIITSSIEHKAVLESAKYLANEGFEVEYVSPDLSGRVSYDDIINKIRDDTLLISIMHVNNETGVIQPVKEIGERLAELGIYFHVDATQSCGKLIEDIRKLKYDMLSFSAHKLYGPQGIGTLVLKKKRYKLPPIKGIMFGGGQEHGIRPGTVPVALVAGMGEACRLALEEHSENMSKYVDIRKIALSLLEQSGLDYKINGELAYIIPNTLNISLTNVSSEALMLSTKQYCGISNGSACNSQEYAPSFVLSAMGIKQDQIENAIRISWGKDTSIEEFTQNFRELLLIAKSLV